MVYLIEPRDVGFFRRLAQIGAVAVVGSTTKTVRHVMGLRRYLSCSHLLEKTMEMAGINSDSGQTDMWQSAIRDENMAKILSVILDEKIEVCKTPIALSEEDVLIFLAPPEEQTFLFDDAYDPLERLEDAWFYIVYIKKIVPVLEEIVI